MATWYNKYVPSWVYRWWPQQTTISPHRIVRPHMQIIPDADRGRILEVESADLCLLDNHDKHRTSHFYAAKNTLIVRRGEPFRIQINFNRDYSPNKDAFSFIFTVKDDKTPSHGHGTLVGLIPLNRIDSLGDSFQWEAAIERQEGKIVTVVVKPSVTCPVTEWKLDIDTKSLENGSKSFSIHTSIFILFNPWCINDQVYMPDSHKLKEYVMHDTTLIWRGSHNRLRPSVWKIGQFERDVLECSINILSTIARLAPAYRGDPIKVSRVLSAAVNSVDDEGILVGNWTEDFSGGTAPTKWTGSAEILQQFYKNQKPVKYAQCWNFSGVLTTIARALGIPSRIITCYSSAHDTQASLTLDIFIDKNNKKIDPITNDSIWNYHVWNEVWMERPDLGIGEYGPYGGWQVVDATPQEASDDMYRVGPASVAAVKNGEVLKSFDCGFVFSEVNADKVYWRYNGPAQPLKMLFKDSSAIGHLISTKAVLKWEREDITNSYKYEESSFDERNTMLKALKQSRHAFSRYYLNDNFNDVEFELELKDDVKIGEPFAVGLKVTNKSKSQAHTATGQINCDAALYTGVSAQEVKIKQFELNLSPGAEDYVQMDVTFNDYFAKLSSQAAFSISALAMVKGTDYEYYAQDDFRIRKPDIKFSFQGKIITQQSVDVILRLTNTLPIPLHKGVFLVEGPGIEKPTKFKIAHIPAFGTAASTFKYIPPYAGRGTLLAKFSSMELDDVDGYIHYQIEPRLEAIIDNDSHRYI